LKKKKKDEARNNNLNKKHLYLERDPFDQRESPQDQREVARDL